MEVVGIEKVDYVSKKTGKPVRGINLHMCHNSEKVEGLAVCTEFISERNDINVKVGDKVELLYNKYGQVIKVCVA